MNVLKSQSRWISPPSMLLRPVKVPRALVWNPRANWKSWFNCQRASDPAVPVQRLQRLTHVRSTSPVGCCDTHRTHVRDGGQCGNLVCCRTWILTQSRDTPVILTCGGEDTASPCQDRATFRHYEVVVGPGSNMRAMTAFHENRLNC